MTRLQFLYYKAAMLWQPKPLPPKAQPTPVDTLSTIPDWKAAHDAFKTARAKHRRVNVHMMAMRQALHKNLGMM